MGTAAIGVFVALVIGLGIYYTNPAANHTSSISRSVIIPPSSNFTSVITSSFKSYDNQIVYVPPTQNENNAIRNCGIYARAQYNPPYFGANGHLVNYSVPSFDGVISINVPLGTTVALTYYGIFNETGSCPIPISFVIESSIANNTNTIRLAVARTTNTSVYGGSLTFISDVAGYQENFTIAQLPSEYHSTVTLVSAIFNLGQIYYQYSTSTAYANSTIYTVR